MGIFGLKICHLANLPSTSNRVSKGKKKYFCRENALEVFISTKPIFSFRQLVVICLFYIIGSVDNSAALFLSFNALTKRGN
jgi:hypothetical protein